MVRVAVRQHGRVLARLTVQPPFAAKVEGDRSLIDFSRVLAHPDTGAAVRYEEDPQAWAAALGALAPENGTIMITEADTRGEPLPILELTSARPAPRCTLPNAPTPPPLAPTQAPPVAVIDEPLRHEPAEATPVAVVEEPLGGAQATGTGKLPWVSALVVVPLLLALASVPVLWLAGMLVPLPRPVLTLGVCAVAYWRSTARAVGGQQRPTNANERLLGALSALATLATVWLVQLVVWIVIVMSAAGAAAS